MHFMHLGLQEGLEYKTLTLFKKKKMNRPQCKILI